MEGTGKVSYPVADLSTVQQRQLLLPGATFIWVESWFLEHRIKVIVNRVLREYYNLREKQSRSWLK
jgi:hypothetical protein